MTIFSGTLNETSVLNLLSPFPSFDLFPFLPSKISYKITITILFTAPAYITLHYENKRFHNPWRKWVFFQEIGRVGRGGEELLQSLTNTFLKLQQHQGRIFNTTKQILFKIIG